MSRRLVVHAVIVSAAAAALTLTLAGPASAHVTVNPQSATKGGYTKVAFRVPNEKDTANTTALEVNLPADTPIASVSLKPLNGWTAVAAKTKLATPIKSNDGEITEAITKITWTAVGDAAIKPGQFQEFEVSLGPLPKDKDKIVFKALQTYSDGDVVRWIDEPAAAGAAEPEHPAPVLTLTAAEGSSSSSSAAAPADTAASEGDGNGTPYGIAGIILGLAALIAGLLAYRRASQPAA